MKSSGASSRPDLPTTVIIGAGSMGGAILSGLRDPSVGIARPLIVTTRSAASADAFDGASDVVALAEETDADANRRAVKGAGIIVLAVKPRMIVDAARGIAESLEPGAIVVSVAAGVPCAAIEEVLPSGIRVVRAMPNTPSVIGRGVTGVAAGASANPEAVDAVRGLFETIGAVLVVREEQIDDVTAVSGSGPAYLFLYAEHMMAAAERRGFTPAQARLLVEGTVAGAAELLRAGDAPPAELRQQVTSPGGTTERAVEVLQAADWGELFDRALAANVRRSRELSGE